jgi:uncharacterized membrane protein
MPGDDDVDQTAIDEQNSSVQEAIRKVASESTDILDDSPVWVKGLSSKIDGLSATVSSVVSLQTRQAEREQAIEEAARQRAEDEARAQANEQAIQSQTSEQVAAIQEAITPPDESAPEAGEQPANIKELPEKDDARNTGKNFWFGKSARRHEDSKKRFGV